ncbi:adenosine monophosphate-protein transferase [Marispirochaeta aestuarii]|uniref:Adenosine monophosphate-protein transferase n=1 Tax=Marispirochaeta aestuarii TaxID=1963862 RepID=A0A1Y1RVZ5_9SPIO|nr:adenosine-specific kinase [Marispirochaeta aestuarii]ORC32926.1 adenosine monophosphate-protein transferase [Marispirochaeta aestuarii]
MNARIEVHQLEWEEGCNIIVGQSHFIKTVEDLGEIMAGSVPGIEFGLAFCEASGPCLIRSEGNNADLIAQAVECARITAAGHSFYLIIKNAFPINVLNQIKQCPEVARIYAATANPLQILTAETGQGRGIIGVVDGFSPKGVEGEKEKRERRELLRKFGYKY